MAANEDLPIEAPEGDALEQRQEVVAPGGGAVSDDLEAPEADALEQARSVTSDDEPDPEGP
jgi:hypothetical protein